MKHFRLTPRSLLLLITLLVLLYGVIYPNFYVLRASLQQNEHWSLANYLEVFSQRVALEAMLLEHRRFSIHRHPLCVGWRAAGFSL